MEAGLGVALKGVVWRIWRVTLITLSVAGGFSKCTVPALVLPQAKPLHPATAAMVKLTADVLAAPPPIFVRVAQLGLEELSTVKAVPPAAGDVTETVWAGRGMGA